MPNDALADLLAKGSPSFRAANAHLLSIPPDRPRPTAEPQPAPKRRIQKKSKDETRNPIRYLVRITSIRRILLDEDNLVPKWHVDTLRYAGILHSDAPGACHIITTQRKALKQEQEHTEIVVELQ